MSGLSTEVAAIFLLVATFAGSILISVVLSLANEPLWLVLLVMLSFAVPALCLCIEWFDEAMYEKENYE